jgi:hypothetical protein
MEHELGELPIGAPRNSAPAVIADHALLRINRSAAKD